MDGLDEVRIMEISLTQNKVVFGKSPRNKGYLVQLIVSFIFIKAKL